MTRLKKFLYNASLMTVTALIMRVAALVFNIWISNKVGAEALGLFSLISSVYGFALTLATSGISLAVTRMVSEAIGHGEEGTIRQIMAKCLAYSLIFGMLAATLLFSLAGPIGKCWLCDERTVKPLKLMSFTLPLIALCSAMNGYFTAVRRVAKNAFSQVAEQAVKICVTVLLLTSIFPAGIENACLALIIGGALSEVISFLLLGGLYIADKHRHLTKRYNKKQGITKELIKTALPVALTTYVRSGLLAVEHSLIPAGLAKYGASRDAALAAYGTFGSMAFPVILFPAALIASFSGMIIPEISESLARGHNNRVKYISGRVWQFSLLFSLGVSGIMLCFSEELGEVLYSSAEAGLYIKLLAPLIPVMYLDSTTDALLKGMGQQFYSMSVNIADALLSVFLVWILVPEFGINGYIFVVITMEILNFSLSALRMLSVSKMTPKLIRWLIKPLICIVSSTAIVRAVFSLLPPMYIGWLSLTVHITVTTIIYIVLTNIFGAIDKSDREWIGEIFKAKKE